MLGAKGGNAAEECDGRQGEQRDGRPEPREMRQGYAAGEKPCRVKERNSGCKKSGVCAAQRRKMSAGIFRFRVHEPGGGEAFVAPSVSGEPQFDDGFEMKCLREEVHQGNGVERVARGGKSAEIAREGGRIAGDIDNGG